MRHVRKQVAQRLIDACRGRTLQRRREAISSRLRDSSGVDARSVAVYARPTFRGLTTTGMRS